MGCSSFRMPEPPKKPFRTEPPRRREKRCKQQARTGSTHNSRIKPPRGSRTKLNHREKGEKQDPVPSRPPTMHLPQTQREPRPYKNKKQTRFTNHDSRITIHGGKDGCPAARRRAHSCRSRARRKQRASDSSQICRRALSSVLSGGFPAFATRAPLPRHARTKETGTSPWWRGSRRFSSEWLFWRFRHPQG